MIALSAGWRFPGGKILGDTIPDWMIHGWMIPGWMIASLKISRVWACQNLQRFGLGMEPRPWIGTLDPIGGR
ncbi:MAG: hypothetical protein NTZ53_04795 [Cyanobacteria bacterium]|nr:hypothetical protein [Cyanobacteriota bacterium]